jgi:hypothetical protein
MRYPRTAAGYAKYLESEHWDILRSAVLERDGGKCVKCGGQGWQVHHRFYRDDWEDAQPGDCNTLCRPCHEKQHPEKVQVNVSMKVTVSSVPSVEECPFADFKELSIARSQKSISRIEYLRWVKVIKPDGVKRRAASFGQKRWLSIPKKVRKKIRSGTKLPGVRPWVYLPRRTHWVNRGTSSN